MKIKTYLAAATLFVAVSVAAQNAQQDFSKVEIKMTKMSDKFYTLEGQGGTIGALVGPDGVFLVDTVNGQNCCGSEKDLAESDQIHRQHSRPWRSHRREREFCKTRRSHFLARPAARSPGASGGQCCAASRSGSAGRDL